MENKRTKIKLGSPIIFIATLAVVIFGSFMIVSAEMGNAVGDTEYLTSVIGKQIVYSLLGLLGFFVCTNFNVVKCKMVVFDVTYFLILASLISTRFFGSTNGAYAWISLGPASIQPSEFAKVFMICYGAKLFGKDNENNNLANFKNYLLRAVVYTAVIVFWQSDFGSGTVLFIISYCIALVPNYKSLSLYQFLMIIGIGIVIVLMLVLLSDFGYQLLSKYSDNYMVGRFLASADPFAYQYDYGYHLVMSLASFVTGGVFGLGYGNSIHKYMNFPNPSSDFILPVIVEEIGIVGFSAFIVFYFAMLLPLITYSMKMKNVSGKIMLLGTFMYFIVHFILNVGGVSGLIPLTGVPLLLISSGGSSMLAGLMALGFSQNEIVKYSYENNSGKI